MRNPFTKKYFFCWLVPLIWAVVSLLSFQFPGDEYALWGISSIAGTWIFFVFNAGDIHNPLIPVSVAIAGGIVLSGLGFLMDKLRVNKKLWLILLVLFFLFFFFSSMFKYESIERAIGKNGSLWSYLFFSINLGVYCSILVCYLVKSVLKFKKICSTQKSD